jgi:L,D-transpeptidase catalytic domain
MAKRQWTFLDSPKFLGPLVLLVAVLDGVGLYHLASDDRAEADRVSRLKVAAKPPAPKIPPPPAMIHPPAVEAMLQSGTLIVISKKSQNMFVFSDGLLWASTPISTGKRRHETPSGFFPILQKRKFHRSNIYSGAPMPFMQRLTWTGIALHAGWVPGYPASHGCVRVPREFARSLFKLTKASATTVVIGDDPLETEVHAQQFALTARLTVHSALAPPAYPPAAGSLPAGPLPIRMAGSAAVPPRTTLASAGPITAPPAPPPPLPPPLPIVPASPAAVVGPQPGGGQTIQLTAAASQAEAEAHWANLLKSHPDLSRFEKSVELATVKSRRVYRLRVSGADSHKRCLKLQSEGISCLNVK